MHLRVLDILRFDSREDVEKEVLEGAYVCMLQHGDVGVQDGQDEELVWCVWCGVVRVVWCVWYGVCGVCAVWCDVVSVVWCVWCGVFAVWCGVCGLMREGCGGIISCTKRTIGWWL